MKREYITPEQDPEAVVGEAVHRLRTAIADIARMAGDPVTREHVLRDAGDIQLASYDLQAVASFARSRLPMEAAE